MSTGDEHTHERPHEQVYHEPPHGHTHHEQPELEVHVQTMYGMNIRVALVQLTIGEQTIVIPTQKAREIGGMLIDVAAASEADGFLFEFVTSVKHGAPPEVGAAIVGEFKHWREHGNSFPEEDQAHEAEKHEPEEPTPN